VGVSRLPTEFATVRAHAEAGDWGQNWQKPNGTYANCPETPGRVSVSTAIKTGRCSWRCARARPGYRSTRGGPRTPRGWPSGFCPRPRVEEVGSPPGINRLAYDRRETFLHPAVCGLGRVLRTRVESDSGTGCGLVNTIDDFLEHQQTLGGSRKPPPTTTQS
jgi:hypothetical protein